MRTGRSLPCWSRRWKAAGSLLFHRQAMLPIITVAVSLIAVHRLETPDLQWAAQFKQARQVK